METRHTFMRAVAMGLDRQDSEIWLRDCVIVSYLVINLYGITYC